MPTSFTCLQIIRRVSYHLTALHRVRGSTVQYNMWRDHIHVTCITMSCYGYSILLLVTIVHLFLCPMCELNFIIGVFVWEKKHRVYGVETSQGFRHPLGWLHYFRIGKWDPVKEPRSGVHDDVSVGTMTSQPSDRRQCCHTSLHSSLFLSTSGWILSLLWCMCAAYLTSREQKEAVRPLEELRVKKCFLSLNTKINSPQINVFP